MLPTEILAAEPPERSTPSRSNNLVGTDFPPSREFPGLLYRTGPQQEPTKQYSNQDYGKYAHLLFYGPVLLLVKA